MLTAIIVATNLHSARCLLTTSTSDSWRLRFHILQLQNVKDSKNNFKSRHFVINGTKYTKITNSLVHECNLSQFACRWHIVTRPVLQHTPCLKKNDNDVAHYNFNAQLTDFGKKNFAEMLLSEYAIKWWFVIPPSIASVSALPGETWTHKFGLFSHAVYRK